MAVRRHVLEKYSENLKNDTSRKVLDRAGDELMAVVVISTSSTRDAPTATVKAFSAVVSGPFNSSRENNAALP